MGVPPMPRWCTSPEVRRYVGIHGVRLSGSTQSRLPNIGELEGVCRAAPSRVLASQSAPLKSKIAEDGFELDVRRTKALAEHLADVSENGEAEVRLAIHEGIEIVGLNAGQGCGAVGDDIRAALAGIKKRKLSQNRPGAEPSDQIAGARLDTHFADEQNVDVVRLAEFAENLSFSLKRGFLCNPDDGLNLAIGESLRDIARLDSLKNIHARA